MSKVIDAARELAERLDEDRISHVKPNLRERNAGGGSSEPNDGSLSQAGKERSARILAPTRKYFERVAFSLSSLILTAQETNESFTRANLPLFHPAYTRNARRPPPSTMRQIAQIIHLQMTLTKT